MDVKNDFLPGTLSNVYCVEPYGFLIPASLTMCAIIISPSSACLEVGTTSLLPFFDLLVLWKQNRIHLSLFLGMGPTWHTCLFYVDGIMLTASSGDLLCNIVGSLIVEFSMKDLGSQHHFIKMFVSRSTNGMSRSQCHYMLEILDHASMTGLKSCSTPIDTQMLSSLLMGLLLPTPLITMLLLAPYHYYKKTLRRRAKSIF